MSIKLMAQVWELDLPDSEKLVLLALADSANDTGKCWPSMRDLSRKCSKSERTVQGVIKSLVAKRLVTRREKAGKGVIYVVYPAGDAPIIGATPAAVAPPQPLHPRSRCTPAEIAGTPAAAADKPSIPINTSSKASPSKRSARGARASFVLPPDVPKAEWDAFVEMRVKSRKPMTDKAKELAVARLRALAQQGHAMADVLQHSILNSYQGLFPPQDSSDVNGTGNIHKLPARRSSDDRSSIAAGAAVLERIRGAGGG